MPAAGTRGRGPSGADAARGILVAVVVGACLWAVMGAAVYLLIR